MNCCVPAETVKIMIVLKQRITGEAIVGGVLQPFYRLLRFVHQRISRSYVVGSVMKVPETFSDIDCQLKKTRQPVVCGNR